MDREKFTEIRDRYLSAARPIQSPEHLKGRERALSELVDALRSPGRHAFIYGYRGVGKTSLAQTAAFQLQTAKRRPTLVSCEPGSTSESVMRDVLVQAAAINPTSGTKQSGFTLGASVAGTGANLGRTSTTSTPSIVISSVADAVTQLDFVASGAEPLVVVIDEFDQIQDVAQHQRFANLIKQLSDRGSAIKIIICGIAESAEALFSEHASIFRQVHATDVERLKWQPRLDIIDDAMNALGIQIPRGLCFRIASISDGFPSFVHLVTEKVLTATFDAALSETTGPTYERGLESAVTSVELTLKRTYESGVHRNTKKLEPVVWAVAADRLLEVNVETIWAHYSALTSMLGSPTDPREKLAQKLGLLCKPNYGPLLQRQRHANYTFQEKMMRAYARLRAERAGCQIAEENPDYSNGSTAKAPEMKSLLAYHDPN